MHLLAHTLSPIPPQLFSSPQQSIYRSSPSLTYPPPPHVCPSALPCLSFLPALRPTPVSSVSPISPGETVDWCSYPAVLVAASVCKPRPLGPSPAPTTPGPTLSLVPPPTFPGFVPFPSFLNSLGSSSVAQTTPLYGPTPSYLLRVSPGSLACPWPHPRSPPTFGLFACH